MTQIKLQLTKRRALVVKIKNGDIDIAVTKTKRRGRR